MFHYVRDKTRAMTGGGNATAERTGAPQRPDAGWPSSPAPSGMRQEVLREGQVREGAVFRQPGIAVATLRVWGGNALP